MLPGSHKNNFGYNEVSEEVGHRLLYQNPQSADNSYGFDEPEKQLNYHQADGGQPVPPGVLNVCAKAGDVSRHDIAGIWVAFFSRCQRYRC